MMNLAQVNLNKITVPTTGGVVNVNSDLKIGTIIAAILPYLFTLAGMLLLVYLIFGGLQLMLSQGEPKAAGAAKSHITNALVGFIIIFFAFWVVQLLGLILNLKGINTIFGGNPFPNGRQ